MLLRCISNETEEISQWLHILAVFTDDPNLIPEWTC